MSDAVGRQVRCRNTLGNIGMGCSVFGCGFGEWRCSGWACQCRRPACGPSTGPKLTLTRLNEDNGAASVAWASGERPPSSNAAGVGPFRRNIRDQNLTYCQHSGLRPTASPSRRFFSATWAMSALQMLANNMSTHVRLCNPLHLGPASPPRYNHGRSMFCLCLDFVRGGPLLTLCRNSPRRRAAVA